MIKLWQPYQMILPVVALMFVLASSAPIGSVQTESHTTTTCTYGNKPNSTRETAVRSPKEATKAQKKSVLDADVLESPITFFKDIFSADRSQEDESDIAPQAGTLVLAIKALAATLLSTII